MNLQPGCPLVVAPRFYLSLDWAERLLLGGIGEEGGQFFPRGPWRRPTAEEQAVLVGDPALLSRDEALARALCLFGLPQHLQSAFWAMLAQAQETGSPCLEGLGPFAQEVARFLDFKGLPVPQGVIFDVLANRPGLPSVQWDDQADRAIGLTLNLAPGAPWPLAEEARWPRLWGGINLGDEAVSLLLVNLPAKQLEAEVLRRCPEQAPPATMDELARRFLMRCAEYPLVRLRVEPGEGYRVPPGGVLIDACTLDMQGPSVMLMLRYEGEQAPHSPAPSPSGAEGGSGGG